MLLSIRRLVVSVGLVGLGLLVFASASALAAAPEAPGPVTVERVGASEASVHGTLSPGAEGHPGTYEFLYKESPTECAGGAQSTQGLALGFEHEEVSQVLTGLKPKTEYTACLLERNPKGEETVGPTATFKTDPVLEAPTTTAPVSANITSSSAMLQGVLNPGKPGDPGSYEFVYRQSASECQRENPETHTEETEHATSVERALGDEKEVVPAVEVSGLSPSTQYTFCLLAFNEAEESALGSPVTFTTLSVVPVIEAESFSSVTSSSAQVTGQLNTENTPVDYHYEYAPASTFVSEPQRTAEVSLPASETPLAAPAQLTGLKPGTEYRFRLVIDGNGKTEEGVEETFTTRPVESTGLPDERAYELVTPVENYHAAVYVPNPQPGPGFIPSPLPFQASANGDAVVYESDPTTSGNGTTGWEAGNAQLATHSLEGGWKQTAIEPNSSNYTTGTYQAFSNNLSVGVLSACSEPVLAPSAPVPPEGNGESRGYNLLYTRNNLNGSYSPLFTTRPRNRPAAGGGKFGAVGVEGSEGGIVSECEKALVYAGASGDFNGLLFEANDSLLEGNGPLEEKLESDVKAEAEETEAQVALENEANALLEEGRILQREGKISLQERQEKYEKPAKNKEQEANVLAGHDDHNDLYMSVGGHLSLVNVLPDGSPEPNATFGAEGPDFSHVISTSGLRIFWTGLNSGVVYVRENGTGTVAVSQGPARFWTASSDGKYAFYTEGEKLYRFDVEDETREEVAGAGAGVQGVLGSSEDGEHLYFVADGGLAAGASAGEPNLYVWHSGAISFVAPLAEGDSEDWLPTMGERRAEVTPTGNAVVFMSERSITGYQNEGEREVYVYEAESNSLHCASCNPTGEPRSSGYLPQSLNNTYTTRWMSVDGSRVFFDSDTALLPQDTDGAGDVYEWERDGAGSCLLTGGCLYLLSGGDSTGAALIDASESGNDVFFVSTAQLVPRDYGNETPVAYDARVGGRAVSPSECTGTGCQGLPAPSPVFAIPASATFDGVGNFPPTAPSSAKSKAKAKPPTRSQKLAKALKTCHGKPRKKRAACEAKAKKDYGTVNKAKSTLKSTGKGETNMLRDTCLCCL